MRGVRVRKVLNSLTFRYIAKYLGVLTASVFALQAGLYGYFSYTYFGNLRESIVDEMETLQLIFKGQSMAGVTSYIDDQYRIQAVNRFSYLVVDESGEKVGGDLEVSPRYKEFSDDWLSFDLTLLRWGETVDVDFLARRATLDNGFQVMVARDYAHALEQSRLIFSTLVRAMIATLILGLIGGFFSASSALKRVERLNGTGSCARENSFQGYPGRQTGGDRGLAPRFVHRRFGGSVRRAGVSRSGFENPLRSAPQRRRRRRLPELRQLARYRRAC